MHVCVTKLNKACIRFQTCNLLYVHISIIQSTIHKRAHEQHYTKHLQHYTRSRPCPPSASSSTSAFCISVYTMCGYYIMHTHTPSDKHIIQIYRHVRTYQAWMRAIAALDGWKQFDDKFSRFHTIVACDGQTTDILQQQSPRYACASRGKSRNKLKRRLTAG